MARFLQQQYPLLAGIFFILITLKGFRSAALPPGSRSINCGGEAYTDPSTTFEWEADPYDNDSLHYGKASKVESQYLQNIDTEVMQTLRYFPVDTRNTKFCYSFSVSNGRTYLLRASFLYGNYDKQNDPPSFVVFFNDDFTMNVSSSSASVPIVRELIFQSNGYESSICLAPYINSTHNPFISTLELRHLDLMYQGGAFNNGSGLMLWRRIDYGANTTVAPLRFPDDKYDRIWEANTTGPVITSSSSSNISDTLIDYVGDLEMPPPKVMATAITTQHPKDNLTFVFEGFGGSGGFRVEMHFQELDESVSDASDPRNFSLAFPTSIDTLPPNYIIVPEPRNPISEYVDMQLEIANPFQIALLPRGGSNSRGPLLNAIELYYWTPPATGTFQDDVDAIKKTQNYLNLVGIGQGDPCIPNGYGWTWINCSNDIPSRIVEIHLASFNLTGDIPEFINNLEKLQTLDLSNNMLSGEIPNFTNLLQLRYLDLSNNMLSGEIPNFIDLSQIQYLDLHNNKLNGTLPENLLHLPLETLNVDNNYLCGNPSKFQRLQNFSYNGNNCTSSSSASSPVLDTKENKNNNTKKYIYAISSLGALYIVSILIPIFICLLARRSKTKDLKSTLSSVAQKKGEDDLHALPFNTKMFSYNEICTATSEFANLLGEGGFGKVYYGTLPSGQAIAIKTLADASKQGLKEFSTEVAVLSTVRHKNLVSLIGYCIENTYMLVYEYIEKGNLRDLIYGDIESIDKPLTWVTRLQIALDASQGLEYLHTGCDPTIIHRDVKSSNILLSEKMQGKVADFGLSRLKEGDSTISHVSTVNVMGTAGYLDPAYNSTSQLTEKSDVYSFGVVLFELICGRAPIDMYSSPPHIVTWVRPAIEKGKVTDIVDPMLANAYKVESMWKVVDVAFGCVQDDRAQRPKMSQVTHTLRESLDIEMDPNLPHHLQDISGGSSASDGKPPTLQYIESLPVKLEPR